jgi:hypothetical protein
MSGINKHEEVTSVKTQILTLIANMTIPEIQMQTILTAVRVNEMAPIFAKSSGFVMSFVMTSSLIKIACAQQMPAFTYRRERKLRLRESMCLFYILYPYLRLEAEEMQK